MKSMLLAGLGALTLVAQPATAGDAELLTSGEIELSFKAHRNWTVLLPSERFTKVGTEFPFAHAGGTGFAAELRGSSLAVDTDGDGQSDIELLSADADASQGKVVTVTFRTEDVTRSVRLIHDGAWKFAPASSVSGKIGDTKIQLIDQNNNGRYDDFGADAMIVGRGKVASYLSNVINVGGELYSLDIDANGSSLSYEPFAGEAGTLDFVSGYETDAKLSAVVVKHASGSYSFNLAKSKKGMKVPTGHYTLESGKVVLGKGDVVIESGRSMPIQVEADQTAVYKWGGPLDAEFAYARAGGQLQFNPNEVWYYGGGGERYVGWNPRGKSPEFVIKEKETGEVLVNATFPGSC